MNNFRLGVFDIFGYIVPGLFHIVLAILALNIVDLEQLNKTISALSIYSVLTYSFLAYVIGFTTDAIAAPYLPFFMERIRGSLKDKVLQTFKEENPDSIIEKYHFGFIYAFADVKAPNTRAKADIFSAMSSMARNISLAFLLYGVLSIGYAIANYGKTIWLHAIAKLLIAVIISILLLYRAYSFRSWSHGHLLNVYSILTERFPDANLQKIESSEGKSDEEK